MHSPRARFGFTLIELLTVIAIIAILMGLLLPVLNPVKNEAKKVWAKNDLTQLVTAVKQFQTDYGTYPIDPAAETSPAKDLEYGANGETGNQDVVNVLRADTNSTDNLASGASPISINTRGVVYLEEPLVKVLTSPKSGLGTGTETGAPSGGKGGVWYDPWGFPYIVAIDANYDGYIGSTSAGGTTNIVLLQYTAGVSYSTWNGAPAVQAGCIAGTFGADHVQGSVASPKNYGGSDDVISWQ